MNILSKQKIEIMALIGKLGDEIGGQKGPIGRDRLKNEKSYSND